MSAPSLHPLRWLRQTIRAIDFLITGPGQFQSGANKLVPIAVPLGNVRYVFLQSRLAHVLLVELLDVDQTTAMAAFVLDPNKDMMIKLDRALPFIKFTDLTVPLQNLMAPPDVLAGAMVGSLEGQRNNDQLPYQTGLNAYSASSNGGPYSGGFLLITGCDQPFEITTAHKPVVNGINFPQSMVATGVGTSAIQYFTPAAATFAGTSIAAAAGLFQAVTMINPTATAFNVTFGIFNNLTVKADNPAIDVQPGVTLHIPVECQEIWADFTVAGQQVIGWQQVVVQEIAGGNP